MKIGILTFHRANNYGAVLQCYALQEVLKRFFKNSNINIIDYRCKSIEYTYKIFNKHIFKPSKFLLIFNILRSRLIFKRFRKEYMLIGPSDFSYYDVVFFGSDQIWNPIITHSDYSFCGLGISGKKIAFAASDGGEIELNSQVKELLNKFVYISCREESLSKKILKTGVHIPVRTICDPVFFISKEQWLDFANIPSRKNYILAYMIARNPHFDEEIEKIGRLLGKEVVRIYAVKSIKSLFFKRQCVIDCLSPQDFVGYIANADMVITTSFHATAFSLILNKPFYVLNFKKRNERICNLLEEVNAIDRFVVNIPHNINYTHVDMEAFISKNRSVLLDILNIV